MLTLRLSKPPVSLSPPATEIVNLLLVVLHFILPCILTLILGHANKTSRAELGAIAPREAQNRTVLDVILRIHTLVQTSEDPVKSFKQVRLLTRLDDLGFDYYSL